MKTPNEVIHLVLEEGRTGSSEEREMARGPVGAPPRPGDLKPTRSVHPW